MMASSVALFHVFIELFLLPVLLLEVYQCPDEKKEYKEKEEE